MRYLPFLALPGVFALAAAPALGGDLFVAPGGGPSTFATIGAAVAAAAPGDNIFVAPGLYVEGFTVNKSVSIFAEPGAVLRHPFSPLPAPLMVRDLAAGGRVVISGLRIEGTVGSLPATLYPTIRLINNAGLVVLHALDVNPLHFSAIIAANSARVLLLDSTFIGTTGIVDINACQVMTLLQLDDTTLYASNCQMVGAPAVGPESTCYYGSGGTGIRAYDSNVVLANSTVRGGMGGYLQSLAAGSALRVSDAHIEFRASSAIGGSGMPGTPGGGWYGASASGSSVLILSVTSSIVGGKQGDGSSIVPALNLSGSTYVVENGVLFPELDVVVPADHVGSIGQPVVFALTGHPDDLHLLFLSPAIDAPIKLPFVPGELWLSLTGLTYLGSVTLDGAGVGGWSAIVPNQPALIGLAAFCQTFAPIGPTPAFGNLVLVPITG